MIIGFDGSRAFTSNRTGTENYSYQLLIHLAKIDKENTYIVYLRPENLECHPEPIRPEGSRPRRLVSGSRSRIKSGMTEGWPENFKFKVLNFKRLWTQLGLALQTFKDPLDLLFTPAHTLPLVRKPGLKTVMTVHDLGAEYLPGMHQLKQRLYLGFITKFQLKTATMLIAVSKATKRDLIKKVGVDEKKVEVIYEGQNVIPESEASRESKNDLMDPPLQGDDKGRTDAKVDIEKEFDIHKGDYFLFVGTIQPRKNLIRLIQAYHKLITELDNFNEQEYKILNTEYRKKDHNSKFNIQNSIPKLVLAGGKGWMNDEIFKLPKKLGIEDRVIFTGRVTDNQLDSLYKNALAFVYPSLFEGFGLPILEAFSNNLPVLTSKISSMPEVAGKAAILIDPYDIDDISNGMKKLLDDNIRERQIKLGKEQLKMFSWEKAAKETLEVFKDC